MSRRRLVAEPVVLQGWRDEGKPRADKSVGRRVDHAAACNGATGSWETSRGTWSPMPHATRDAALHKQIPLKSRGSHITPESMAMARRCPSRFRLSSMPSSPARSARGECLSNPFNKGSYEDPFFVCAVWIHLRDDETDTLWAPDKHLEAHHGVMKRQSMVELGDIREREVDGVHRIDVEVHQEVLCCASICCKALAAAVAARPATVSTA
jgi:hypothetical protein